MTTSRASGSSSVTPEPEPAPMRLFALLILAFTLGVAGLQMMAEDGQARAQAPAQQAE